MVLAGSYIYSSVSGNSRICFSKQSGVGLNLRFSYQMEESEYIYSMPTKNMVDNFVEESL